MSVQSYLKGLGFGLGQSCSYSLTAIFIRLVFPDAPTSISFWYASFGNILVYLVVYYGDTEGYIITGNRPMSFEFTSSHSSPLMFVLLACNDVTLTVFCLLCLFKRHASEKKKGEREGHKS